MTDRTEAAQQTTVAAILRIAGDLHTDRLPYAAYVEHRQAHEPSPSTAIRAFGSWRAASTAAGLNTNRYPKGGEAAYDPTAALTALAQCAHDYATQTGRTPYQVTQRFYSQWRAARTEKTCAALTLVNRHGSWRRAKALALSSRSTT